MTVWAPVHQFEIACGAAGAFVDVTALGHVLTDQGGVTRSYGRKSSFVDFSGGTFSFTLDNRDGRYTPDSTVSGATPLSEGQVVSWQTDTRLVSGKIAVGSGIQLIFPDGGGTDSSRIRVTCEDAIVEGARHRPSQPLAGAAVVGSRAYLYWPLNDAAGSTQASEQSGNNGPALLTYGAFAFGAAGVPATAESQVSFTSGALYVGAVQPFVGAVSPAFNSAVTTPAYASGSRGFIGFWYTPVSSLAQDQVNIQWTPTSFNGNYLSISFLSGSATATLCVNGVTATPISMAISIPGTPAFVAAGLTYTLAGSTYTYTLTLYVNGSSTTTTFTSTTLIPAAVAAVQMVGGSSFAHLSHTRTLVHEEWAGVTTVANRLKLIASTTPEIALGTLPTDLSTQPVGNANTAGQSVTDMLNDVARTEQGQLSCSTSGTVGAPVQTIGLRARNRPATASVTWAIGTDILGTPPFLRDLSDTVSDVDVTGAGVTATTGTDAALYKKVGSSNATLNVLSAGALDAYTAGTDRLNRGRKTGLDTPNVTIPGISNVTNRSSDLLALALGDRHETTGIPVPPLNAATYDGYLIGVDEYWDSVTANFTLYYEAAGARTAVFGTDEFMADGALKLNAAITSTTATTMTVATNVPASGSTPATLLAVTGAGTPYDLIIDAEQVTVTACTAPSAGVQTATITRGVNSTTAATHLIAALLEVAPAITPAQPVPTAFAY